MSRIYEGLVFDAAATEIGATLPVEDDSIFEKIVDVSRNLKKYSLTPDRISCAEGDVRIYFGTVEVLLGDNDYEEKTSAGTSDPGKIVRIVSGYSRYTASGKIMIRNRSRYRLYRPGKLYKKS